MLTPQLERLHYDVCCRHKAGNRELHFDPHCMLNLLCLFKPTVTRLRAIEQANELNTKRQTVSRTINALSSIGGLAEARRLVRELSLRGSAGPSEWFSCW